MIPNAELGLIAADLLTVLNSCAVVLPNSGEAEQASLLERTTDRIHETS